MRIYILCAAGFSEPDNIISAYHTPMDAFNALTKIAGPIVLTGIDTTGVYFGRVDRPEPDYKIKELNVEDERND